MNNSFTALNFPKPSERLPSSRFTLEVSLSKHLSLAQTQANRQDGRARPV